MEPDRADFPAQWSDHFTDDVEQDAELPLDKGIAVAVVGYTDALVATLFAQNGVPVFVTDYDTIEVERQLDAIELELSWTKKSAR